MGELLGESILWSGWPEMTYDEVHFIWDLNHKKELAMLSTKEILFQAKGRPNAKMQGQYDFEKMKEGNGGRGNSLRKSNIIIMMIILV